MGRDGHRRAGRSAEPASLSAVASGVWLALALAWIGASGCAKPAVDSPPAATSITAPAVAAPLGWGAPAAVDLVAGVGLERVARLVAGPVAFDPSQARLALAAGDPIRILDREGKLIEQWSLGAGVIDLRFASDGSLWVLGRDGLVHGKDGRELCRAEGAASAEQILGVSAAGEVTLASVQGLETGVWGALLTVKPDCSLTEGELRQPTPTALAWRAGVPWTGLSARTGPGPSRIAPPSLEGPSNAITPLFKDAPDAARVADLVVADGALAVADTGAWELWSLDGSRRIASGQASAPTAEGVPGTSVAAVGTALLSLVDGTVTPDALPAPVVAISPDGSLWVLGAEEDRALWRFGGAGN